MHICSAYIFFPFPKLSNTSTKGKRKNVYTNICSPKLMEHLPSFLNFIGTKEKKKRKKMQTVQFSDFKRDSQM